MGLPLYGTVLSLTIAVTNSEIQLALGATTFVHLTSTSSLNVIGLLATGGNVDGMVVTFANENASNNVIFLHDSSSETTASNRFANFGVGNKVVNATGAVTYRYNAPTLRWHHIGSSI